MSFRRSGYFAASGRHAIHYALLLVLGHPIQHLIAIVTHAVAEGSSVAKAFLGVTLMGAKFPVLPVLDCLDFLGCFLQGISLKWVLSLVFPGFLCVRQRKKILRNFGGFHW